MSAHPQATDEDSPPNNFLTYTITSASAFPNYFNIIMVEGYAGMLILRVKLQSIVCKCCFQYGLGCCGYLDAKLAFKLSFLHLFMLVLVRFLTSFDNL